MVGGLIMAHGDDNGLRLPPRVAPTQAVVIAVKDDEPTNAAAREVAERLTRAGVRVRVDTRTDQGFGRRVTEWELRGVPVRVEIGPRDLEAGQVTVVRRDSSQKTATPADGVSRTVPRLLKTIQAQMLAAARARLDASTVDASSVTQALAAAQTGFARIAWRALGEDGERVLYEQAVSVRCLQTADGAVPDTEGNSDDLVAVVGRSY